MSGDLAFDALLTVVRSPLQDFQKISIFYLFSLVQAVLYIRLVDVNWLSNLGFFQGSNIISVEKRDFFKKNL